MRSPYSSLFDAIRELDKQVGKAIDHFNNGRLKGFKLNYPFKPLLWLRIKGMAKEDLDYFFSDHSLFLSISQEVEDFAGRANETLLRFIVPSEKNLKCLEYLLGKGFYDEENWLDFFGKCAEVNALVACHAEAHSLTLEQSERLYTISEELRSRGESETASLLAQKACIKISERFSFGKSEEAGRALARAFISAPDYKELFKVISRCDVLSLTPYIKDDLASNDHPFDTFEMVDRAQCFIQGGLDKKNHHGIEKIMEKLKAMGFSDEILRKAPSTKREMLCDDLGM